MTNRPTVVLLEGGALVLLSTSILISAVGCAQLRAVSPRRHVEEAPQARRKQEATTTQVFPGVGPERLSGWPAYDTGASTTLTVSAAASLAAQSPAAVRRDHKGRAVPVRVVRIVPVLAGRRPESRGSTVAPLAFLSQSDAYLVVTSSRGGNEDAFCIARQPDRGWQLIMLPGGENLAAAIKASSAASAAFVPVNSGGTEIYWIVGYDAAGNAVDARFALGPPGVVTRVRGVRLEPLKSYDPGALLEMPTW